MGFGQPFYTYNGGYSSTFNSGYVAPQQQPSYLYNQQLNGAQNPQNQPINGYQQQQTQAIPPKTNMPLVTSLLDAMNKTVEPNTNAYYADQDKPLIYLVSMDMQGRKTSKTFEVKDITEQVAEQPNTNIDLSSYVTKTDLQESLKAFKDEITNYAKSFLKQQVPVDSVVPTSNANANKKIAKKEDKE